MFCCLGWCYEQKLDQNHWFSYTNTTEMSPKSPTRASISSTSFWSRIISRYTRTIYASRGLHFRGDRSPPKCTNRSQVPLKTEAFGKFQLRPRLGREPPYQCVGVCPTRHVQKSEDCELWKCICKNLGHTNLRCASWCRYEISGTLHHNPHPGTWDVNWNPACFL